MAIAVGRRTFVTLLGGAAAAPMLARRVARAQQTLPVIGFLDTRSPDVIADRVAAFRQGLKEAGHIDGETITILFRWAGDAFERLPALAAGLVDRQVAVIATGGNAATLAAHQATTSIPIVFVVNQDPVRLGLVASLARPGGNATGINFFGGELTAKRLQFLRQLLPAARSVAVLVNPANATTTEATITDVNAAARTIGLETRVHRAASNREIDAVFASFAQEKPDALFVATDPFFTSRRVQLANLAIRHGIPLTSGVRDIAQAGGLMSYGTSNADAYRQAGAYTGRIGCRRPSSSSSSTPRPPERSTSPCPRNCSPSPTR